MIGTTSTGIDVAMDWEEGPSPMQLVLQSAGACSLVDVVVGLKGREVRAAKVDLSSTRAGEAPRVFETIHMTYVIDAEAPEKLIRRLIQKSHEKYCSVGNMLSSSVEITWDLA